ncbi:MAG: PaaI family thioesterase [Pseudomonadota bacterium]
MKDSKSPHGHAPLTESTQTGPHSVELDDWISCAPFEEHLGMEIVSALEGKATLRMPFRRELAQGDALLHGGALISLADTAMVMAIKSTVLPKTRFVTVTANIDYLAPVTHGTVTANAEITKREGRKLFGEVAVFDENDQQVVAFSTLFVLLREQ